jgi:hypothetical protein
VTLALLSAAAALGLSGFVGALADSFSLGFDLLIGRDFFIGT